MEPFPRPLWGRTARSLEEEVSPFFGVTLRDGGRLLPPSRGWLVLVMDDLGFRMEVGEELFALRIPIIFSILPGVRYTLSLAKRVGEMGYDLFLHQPMEPEGYPHDDPGPRALWVHSSSEEIRRVIEENLSLPLRFSGVNNHMGSRFTADEKAMRIVLEEIKRRDLIYLDSLTTPRSVAPSICRELQVLCIFRDVFLDHSLKEEKILQRVEEWRRSSERKGISIAIAHPHPKTLSVLRKAVPRLQREGFRFVGVKEIRFWLQYGRDRRLAERRTFVHE